MIIQKRYQYWSSTGIQWTPWFNTLLSDIRHGEKWQMKGKLLNEYREV